MDDLLHFILSYLVTNPQSVTINKRSDNDTSTIYLVGVDQPDMGKVIGKEGKIIRAIRSLAKIWAVKQNQHIDVELLEQTSKS